MGRIGEERVDEHFKDYYSKENKCKLKFQELLHKYGTLWHIYTSGKEQEFYNTSADDYKFSINNIALSANECAVTLFTDVHMENHIHLLAGGPIQKCNEMLITYANRLKRRARKLNKDINISGLHCKNPNQITSLEAMRNVIIYINRNGYTHNDKYIPFSYPWGGGYLFYNYQPYYDQAGVLWRELPYRLKREISYKSMQNVTGNIKVEGDMIVQRSYLNISDAEMMFRDSHHYLQSLTKDLRLITDKAFSNIGEVMVTREEMYHLVCILCKEKYNITQPSLLPSAEKLKVAHIMKSKYHASNALIRSTLRLTESEVENLFPESVR